MQIPDELLQLARTRTNLAFLYLDIQREVEIYATYSKQDRTPFSLSSTYIRPDWTDEETDLQNTKHHVPGPYAGKDGLFDAIFPDEKLMKQHLTDTPDVDPSKYPIKLR